VQLAKQGAEVNLEVYTFLNRNASDRNISLLKDRSAYISQTSAT